MHRPAAVLFDLWGTLVPPIPPSVRDAVSRDMAVDLGVDPDAFADAYRDSYRERFLGETGSLEETIRLLAERSGVAPSEAATTRAATRRLDLTRRLLASDSATLATLDELRARGFRLGLVTDSSIETPTLWPSSPLAGRVDAAAFSCAVGVRKPDPRLFLRVVDELGCIAVDCVYVGDGGGRELTAAAALGMLPVRVRPPDAASSDRYDDDTAFDGVQVAALSELLSLPWAKSAGSAL